MRKFNPVSLFVVLFAVTFFLTGCGKKEEPKTDKKTDTKTETKTETTDKKDDKKKKDFKKSDAPKKQIKSEVPADWTELVSKDGKFTFKAPSNWIIGADSETKFSATSEDNSMGLTFVIFANDKITSDELLGLALADFDFEPDGEAFAYEEGNMEGYITAARGKLNGVDMMMYVMSAVENGGTGNYVLYTFTPTANFEKNGPTLEQILYSANHK
jgi:predicted small lipoprotein YifL